jgi:hypothetical protein
MVLAYVRRHWIRPSRQAKLDERGDHASDAGAVVIDERVVE